MVALFTSTILKAINPTGARGKFAGPPYSGSPSTMYCRDFASRWRTAVIFM